MVDKIPGGLADKQKPKNLKPKQLAKGIKVEMEHTTDKSIAREIALDHLTEDPNYYDKLQKIEAAKKTKKTDHVLPRQPPELEPLGVWRTNFDYGTGESPYQGEPESIPEFRKRKRKRRKRKIAAILLATGMKFDKKHILILDDQAERHQAFDKLLSQSANLTHVYTYHDAVAALESGVFDVVYLDHDIADYGASPIGYGERELTGADVALYMSRVLDSSKRPQRVVIHSANPVGAANIAVTLETAGIPCIREPFGNLAEEESDE